jgi:chromosome partitioning protein
MRFNMPVIVFASPKGGVGKTTSSFILASELAYRGMKTCIIDADPNHPIAGWQAKGGSQDNLVIMKNDSEDSILDEIDSANNLYDFVIIDLEGTANLSVAYAISSADLVIIPCQRSTLDAGEAAKAISLVKKQSQITRRIINTSMLLTRTNPVIRTKSLKKMLDNIDKSNIDIFDTEITEREAFKAIFDYSTPLSKLNSKSVSSLEKAMNNSAEFAAEVIKKINI